MIVHEQLPQKVPHFDGAYNLDRGFTCRTSWILTYMDREAFTLLGQRLTAKHQNEHSTQLEVLQQSLVLFATNNAEQIVNNDDFSLKFTNLCLHANLDPLELVLLKDSTNSINALSVKIIEIGHLTRDINGGLILIKELLFRVNQSIVPLVVDEGRVIKAINLLSTLGQGYTLLTISNSPWLKFTSLTGSSVTQDQRTIYELCEFTSGYVTVRLLIDNFSWTPVRCEKVIDEMIRNAFLWVDEGGGEKMYWVPSWLTS